MIWQMKCIPVTQGLQNHRLYQHILLYQQSQAYQSQLKGYSVKCKAIVDNCTEEGWEEGHWKIINVSTKIGRWDFKE